MTDDRYTVAMTVHREDGTPISIIELAGHQPRLLINAAAVATDAALKAHPATGEPAPQLLDCGCTEQQAAKSRQVSADVTDYGTTYLTFHTSGGGIHVESEKGRPHEPQDRV